MDEEELRKLVHFHLEKSPRLHAVLVAILWIGSLSRRTDVHPKSDIDLQFILEQVDDGAMRELGDLVRDIPGDLDLSVLYLDDIFGNHDPAQMIDFQDGTKGAFFMYVLAEGTTIYGENPYPQLTKFIGEKELTRSIRYTIREYAARLRVFALYEPFDSTNFTKYALKLLKDLLILNGELALTEFPSTPYHVVRSLSEQVLVRTNDELAALRRLGTLSSPTDAADRFIVLSALDDMSHRVLREHQEYESS